MAVHPVVTKVVIPTITGFSGLLPITITFDPLAVTNSVLETTGMDPDTFSVAKAGVPTFLDPFQLSVEIPFFSLTYLSHFLILGFI